MTQTNLQNLMTLLQQANVSVSSSQLNQIYLVLTKPHYGLHDLAFIPVQSREKLLGLLHQSFLFGFHFNMLVIIVMAVISVFFAMRLKSV